MTNIYAVLNSDTALNVFREASMQAVSNNPVVRAIIDNKVGHVCLAYSRPADETAERTIKLVTETPERAKTVLGSLPGVNLVR